MVFEIAGKVAIVTGGASGLGYQIVRVFLREGAMGVAIFDINKHKGIEAEGNIRKEFGSSSCIFIEMDISDEEQMRDAFETTINVFKQLDIVVNNAGILQDLDWKKSIITNLGGCMCGTRLAMDEYLPKYKSGKEGIIINISSIAGVIPLGMCPIYSATKHGIVALSRCYGHAKHYERTKVKIITVCPGHMATPMILEAHTDCFNLEYVQAFEMTVEDFPTVGPEVVAEGLLEVTKKASNGSVWIIEGEENPYQISHPNLRKVVNAKL